MQEEAEWMLCARAALSLHPTAPLPQCPAGHLPSSLSSSCLVWGRDRAPQTHKEGAPGSAQSWASQNNGILVENLRCYHEKLMGVYCSRVWALLSVYDCYNSLLRSKHPIRPLLPSYSENRNEDWIGSKLPTVIGRIENQRQTRENSFVHSFILLIFTVFLLMPGTTLQGIMTVVKVIVYIRWAHITQEILPPLVPYARN